MSPHWSEPLGGQPVAPRLPTDLPAGPPSESVWCRALGHAHGAESTRGFR